MGVSHILTDKLKKEIIQRNLLSSEEVEELMHSSLNLEHLSVKFIFLSETQLYVLMLILNTL